VAKIPKTTQSFIPIKEIRDGVVVMKDHSLRLVLITSSINFALRSHDEQVAILLQYQNLLNSLDFHVEFFVQSRRLDINPYLKTLEERLRGEQENELLRIQIQEYIRFIKAFTEDTRIMEKRFFVVVSYNSFYAPDVASISSTLGLGKNKEAVQMVSLRFEEGKVQLEQRAIIVEQGLASCGITSQRLSTEGLTELFYKTFNPGDLGHPISFSEREQAV
jgi:hypothetical protein